MQRQQLMTLPASGWMMGLLTALPYARPLGWPSALGLGAALAVVLGLLAGWLAWRSDHAARHSVANALLFCAFLAPLLGGMNLVVMHMAGVPAWAWPAWAAGVALVVVPLIAAAWQTRQRLLAQGADGPWATQHLYTRAGTLRADALVAAAGDRPPVAPWLVGTLAVNAVLAWRAQGGSDLQLMPGVVALLALGVVWAAVAQVGPALGKAWFVQSIERQTGRRFRHEHWAELQALRRSHWLARRFMVDG